MTETTVTATMPSFSVAIPEAWFVPDLDTADAEGAAAALVDDRLADRADLRRWRQPMVETLTTFIEESNEREATDAALFLDVVDGLPLTASIQVMIASGRPDAAGEGERGCDGERAPGDVRDRRVRSVTLPGGPATRIACARESVADDGAPGLIVEYVEHWFPVPGRERSVLVLGETPHLAFAGEIAAAFDRIAATFRFSAAG
jgi:hypothetical protein